MSRSNCCFLTCKQVSQEAGQVVWYSHLFQNFTQFIVVHTDKGFGIVNKAEIDVFLELSCFLMIQSMLAIWSLVPVPFLNSAYTYGSSMFKYCWSLAWRILSIILLAYAAAVAESLQSDSVQPHRWQPTRLPCPWDSPCKNTGVGCHFLLQCRKVKSESEVAQSCLTLSDPMDCSLPGSSVHGISQARVLEWVAIVFAGSHMKWVQLYGNLNILWHCLSLGMEWKLTFSSPVATAEFSKFASILSAAREQHHLLGFETAQLQFHHLYQLCS